MVVGYGGTPWVKAAAVADGLQRATGDTLIVADADVWVDKLDEAVGVLQAGMAWAIPHRLVHRLNQEATRRVLEGAEPAAAAEEWGYDQEPYDGWAGGGVTVLRRSGYERAPMDHRFAGWGQEDASWAIALRTLIGDPARLGNDLWHLWHPSQPRLSRTVGNREGEALWMAYRMARRHPDRMERLVAEGRAACR